MSNWLLVGTFCCHPLFLCPIFVIIKVLDICSQGASLRLHPVIWKYFAGSGTAQDPRYSAQLFLTAIAKSRFKYVNYSKILRQEASSNQYVIKNLRWRCYVRGWQRVSRVTWSTDKQNTIPWVLVTVYWSPTALLFWYLLVSDWKGKKCIRNIKLIWVKLILGRFWLAYYF